MLDYLPQEVVVEILCRLPTKSLLRFRCVSKSWRSLIGDPSFISLHRRRSPSHLLFHIYEYVTGCGYHYRFIFRSLSHDRIPRNYPLSLPPGRHASRCSPYGIFHCHGLLCLTDYHINDSLIICNPSLRRFFSVPRKSSYRFPDYTNFALGFDSRNCDYKIVSINTYARLHYRFVPAVEIYSFASGTWRTLPHNVAPVCVISRGRDAPVSFVNGLVHWGAKSRERTLYDYVLSFDFVDEVFHEIALPECLRCLSSDYSSVNVVRGSDERPLTVYHCDGVYPKCYSDNDRSPISASIWVMKEYGVVESWNILFAFDFARSCLQIPSIEMDITSLTDPPDVLCVLNNGEILLLAREHNTKMLYFIDVEKRRFVDLQFREHSNAFYYAESLVVPNTLY